MRSEFLKKDIRLISGMNNRLYAFKKRILAGLYQYQGRPAEDIDRIVDAANALVYIMTETENDYEERNDC